MINVRSIAGETIIDGGVGSDTINVGSGSQGSLAIPDNDQGGSVDGVGALLSVIGNAPAFPGTVENRDVLNVNESGDTADNVGVLTSTSITGLGMAGSIDYETVERLNLTLGSGNDNLFVEGTSATASTTIDGGDEAAVDNRVNDVINVGAIGGFTRVMGGTGNDVLRANYDVFGRQTYANGIAAQLFLDGQDGSDLYEIGLAGFGSSLISASEQSNGPLDGQNRMRIYGTPRKDDFLFRPGVIAAVGLDADGIQTGLAERINYDSTIDDIVVYGGDEIDTFVLDDTNSPLTLYGEGGNDVFQVGQIFASPRHPADIPTGSDPSGFNPGLDEADYFRTTLTTRGYLSNGNGPGNPATIYGGIGNDSFTVYSNKADLFLYGEEDDDNFTVRAFVKVDPNDPKAPFTNINGGQGPTLFPTRSMLRSISMAEMGLTR